MECFAFNQRVPELVSTANDADDCQFEPRDHVLPFLLFSLIPGLGSSAMFSSVRFFLLLKIANPNGR